jgi:hypothetical protein
MLPRDLERQSVLIEKVCSLPAGAPVELITTAHRRIQGRLAGATDDTVHIDTANGETVWIFDEIRTVRRLDRPRFALAHRLLALLLAFVGILPAADVRSKALDIPYGARIEIRTQAREKLTGLLRGVAEEGITLEQTVNQQLTLRAIPFSEIRSLKYPRNGLHPAAVAALTIGALWGVGALMGGG